MNTLRLILIALLGLNQAQGQTLISKFNFNATSLSGLRTAETGSDATSINANTQSNGDCAYVTPSGGNVGIDLTVPAGQFMTNSISMFWDYTKRENQANFFELGDMAITMNSGSISITFAVTSGGTKATRTYNNVYTLGANGTSYVLAFSYDAVSGKTTFNVNGTDVYTATGTTNSPLNWSAVGSGSAVIGRLMDGSGNPTLCEFRMYGAAIALPVEWLETIASLQGNDAQILWSTASEKNNSHFEIERSINGSTFENIGRVNGNGNSNEILHYAFIDMGMAKTAANTVYYRIKQIDFDGKYDYSRVMTIRPANANKISVYPTLLNAGNSINITGLGAETNTVIELKNQAGNSITTITTNNANTASIATDGFAKGVYYLFIVENGKTETKKLMIQ